MNIFFLAMNPSECAKYHCNKHVVKMILEYAQILCTAHRVIDGTLTVNEKKRKTWVFQDFRENIFYKSTHVNHPSVIWARQTTHHYNWLYKLFSDLNSEYQHRYHKTHLCWTKLNAHINRPPSNLSSDLPFKSPPLAMPDACKIPESAVDSYRKYYILEKASFCKWTNRPVPEWFLSI
eukprot:1194592-Prorocentrum_minimum.AAC.2